MFKRIIKIVGIVLLCFVLLVGGVVAFMAIRGDFKKQVIKPTAIDFSISKTDLVLDVSVVGQPSLNNGQVFSFTVSAEPVNITETECTIKLSSPLITFVEWSSSKADWVKYESNKFHLNKPIYFVVNNIVNNAAGKDYAIDESEYSDGVLEITVTDKSGLLYDTLELEIDRAITSISFKDQYIDTNNIISNGLFAYEEGKYEGLTAQKLEAIEGQDYPLEVITAPLKALKPFDGKDAKIYDIYLMEEGQPQLITYSSAEDVVKKQRFDDNGQIIAEVCDFLKYDINNGNFVFNSLSSGEYEFKLVTYPTYAIQEEVLNNDEISFIDRLKLETILTKTVVITVNGTEAEEIVFESGNASIDMQLLQNNKWIVNNATTIDMYDLGLTLSKTNSGTEILGRYNELAFLNAEHFTNNLKWTFKQAKEIDIPNNKVTYNDAPVVVNFYLDRLGKTKATISGLDSDNIDNTAEYDVSLTRPGNGKNYTMMLSYVEYEEDGVTIKNSTTITFNMIVDEDIDDITEDVLSLQEDSLDLVAVDISKRDEVANTTYTPQFYLNLQVGDCFILNGYDEDEATYKFKTLKAGLYLAMLGKDKTNLSELPTLINNNFITSIEPNGADSVITIMPIDGDLSDLYIELYAVVVNSNGSWTYTKTSKTVAVNEITSKQLNFSNNAELNLPVVVGDSLDYGSGFDVEDLVSVQEESSYSEILLFAPEYSLLTQKPIEWDKGLIVYKYNEVTTKHEPINSKGITFSNAEKYYTKNNYEMVDIVSIVNGDTEYFLLGYMESGRFVNKVVPTGTNYYSKLYPVVVKSRYLQQSNRLQTAEEYVNELLSGKQGTSSLTNITGQITYDLALLQNGQITKDANYYVVTTTSYSADKDYYVYNLLRYELVEDMPQEIIDKWDEEKHKYYEKVDAVKVTDVLGSVDNININLAYYTLSGETLEQTSYSIGSSDFIDNWDNYYIIVSHYLIDSVEKDDTHVTITAYACSKNIKLTNIAQTFVITASDYNNAIRDKFDVNYSHFYQDLTITATSYYDFTSSSTKPTVDFGGTYFDGTQYNTGDCQVIAGHKEIKFGWDGTTNDPIKDKVVHTSIYVNNGYNEQILQDIIGRLSISASEYDSDNNFVTSVVDKITISSPVINYIRADDTYNPLLNYYIFDGEFKSVDIVEFDPVEQYYIKAITVGFEVNDIITDGHYIKFVWSYNFGNTEYKMYSPKMTIQSREIEGYNINIGKTLYKATLLTQDTAPSEFYEYDKVNNKFTLITDADLYIKSTHYALESVAYVGDIYYLLEVGYNTDYTYAIYAVDNYGNYLVYNDLENFVAARASAMVALKLKEEGGWITPKPFYAEKPQYQIQGNGNVKFEFDAVNKVNNITFAQISTDFTQIKLQPADAKVNEIINIKVIHDGKFEHNPINVLDSAIKSQLATKQCTIPASVYTYNGNPIDEKLLLAISGFNIEMLGQNVSELYTLQGNKIVEKANQSNVIASLDLVGSQWVISRQTYDNISIDVTFTSVIKTEIIKFEFTSPYEIQKSNTNPTTIIYSGTNFVLASTGAEDALYTLKATSGNISIKYIDPSDSEEKTINIDSGKWAIAVPDVPEQTNCEFEIWYEGEKIGAFTLTISPNIIITADVRELIDLDDLNNNQYDFTTLNIKQYNASKEYLSYSASDLDLIDDLSDLNYTYKTFIDSEFNIQYSTNVINIDDNVLQVISPISELGTYYVKVEISKGNIKFGEVKFEIETKSQVVNANNNEIDTIIIGANTLKEYNLSELQQLFKLSRGNNIYYPVSKYLVTTTYAPGETYKHKEGNTYELLTEEPVDNTIMYKLNPQVYIAGITYKLVKDAQGNDVYELVNDTAEDIQYYHKLDLTDVFWINTTNESLEVIYKYSANKTLTQTLEYKYTKYIGDWAEGVTYYYIDNGQYAIATEKQENVDYYTLEIIQKLTYFDGTNTSTYKLLGTSYNMANYTFDIHKNQFVKNGNTLTTQNIGNNIAYQVVDGNSIIYCKQNAYIFENVANSNDLLVLSIEDNGKTIYNFSAVVGDGDFDLINDLVYTGSYYKKDRITQKYALTTESYSASTYYKLKCNSIVLGELQSLGLLYNSFGANLTANIKNVDAIEYSVELVFNTKHNIKTNDIYNIYVQPYTVEPTTNVVLNNSYVLFDSANASATDLFNITGLPIENIEFGTRGNDYEIETRGSRKVIKFNPNGNNYTTYIPVTLTYNTGENYSYNVEIIVLNKTSVSINYPYNVDNSALTSYTTFNASITELVKSVDNLYDVNDFAMWLGVDTTVDNWQNNTRIKYDLALKGDTINLTQDALRNISRYNVWTFENVDITTDVYAKDTYYKYDTRTKSFKLVSDESVTDWNNLTYFKRVQNTTTSISKVELVAVSSTYVNNLTNVVDSLALNGNTIAISSSLNYTGYVAFKVYAGDSSAYGYYVLKIVDDSQFNNTIGYGQARNTKTISGKVLFDKVEDKTKYPYIKDTYYDENGNLLTTDVEPAEYYRAETIIEFIRTSGYDIASVASISYDLINSDSSNVYLFMVDSLGAGADGKLIFKDNSTIANGQLIPNNKPLKDNNNIQVMTVAVVVQSGTSLVHVCNYEIILQVDVDIDINIPDGDSDPDNDAENDLITAINSSKYEYSTELEYIYGGGNNYDFSKTIADGGYITVTGNGGQPNTIKFDNNYLNSPGLTYDEITGAITLTTVDGAKLIATINGAELKLDAPVGEEICFYLKLINANNFEILLCVNLKPFTFMADTQFEVGNWNGSKFDNELDLESVFGNYGGMYKYSINNGTTSDNINAGSNKKLEFNPIGSEYTDNVTITLTSVVPSISKTIIVKVKSNIRGQYNASYEGYSQNGVRVIPDKNTGSISEVGSSLYVNIDGNTITIQDAETATKTYLTINVGSFKSAKFTLTTDGGQTLINPQTSNPYRYFVKDGTLAEYIDNLTSSQSLQFVHSALDVKLKLNITIYMENGTAYSTSYPLYIELPKTYTLSATYRVTGAEYETVANNSDLILKDDTNTDIKKHFFGTDDNANVSGIINGAEVKVNGSRIGVEFNGQTYSTYDDIKALGLLTENNPNKLVFSLQAIEGNSVSSIDDGILTFRADTNNTENILTLTNTTTELEYKFIVLTDSADYSKITYNDNLLQIDTNNDKKMDYISIPYSHFFDSEGNDATVDLAYLQYLPTNEDGQIGVVVMNVAELTYEFVRDVASADHVSKLVIGNNGLSDTSTNEITLTIITVNGVADTVKLVISNFVDEYGYEIAGNNYEKAYAGTQIGKLIDKDNNDNQRLNVKVNGSESSYTLNYIGSVNGSVSHWYLGVEPNYPVGDTTMIWYDSTTKIISSRSVANDTLVTMMFDVKENSTSLIVGRVYYVIMLQNNIKIGLNPKLDSQFAVDLYLGSQIYTFNEAGDIDETVIDLLNSKDADGNYNNLFVTLEQYSTNNVIGENTKALYNGTADKSILDITDAGRNVSNYLRFAITNKYGECADKADGTEIVRVDNDKAKLYIKGNPRGSFTLNVFSANGTGYGESFAINLHQYDYTTAQYSEQVNRNLGGGWASGTNIDLFKDVGKTDSNIGKYAFASYRIGYGDTETINQHSIRDGVGENNIYYQVLVFDYGTTISEIKNSTKWDDPSLTVEYITEYTKPYTLPSVKYSEAGSGNQYQIVSIRLTIQYNGEPKTYFAHYLVYNDTQLTVNEHYRDNKTITYNEKTGTAPNETYLAWGNETADTNTIIIMGENGMYEFNNNSDIIKGLINGDKITKYKAYIQVGDKDPRIITGLTFVDPDNSVVYDQDELVGEFTGDEKVVGTLPYKDRILNAGTADEIKETEYLFKNQANIKFILKATDGGATLVEDSWTIKAGTTIEANSSRLLRDFFLTSEIEDQDYYNINIIGLMDSYDDEDAKKFVNVISDNLKVEPTAGFTEYEIKSGDCEYILKKLTYTYNGTNTGSPVCSVTQDYYVLVGHDNVMSFNFNGGDYYINATIDDDEIDVNKDEVISSTETKAIINIANFAKVWKYDPDNGFVEDTSATISIPSNLTSPFNKDGTNIILEDVNKLTENKYVNIIVSVGDISRTIQVYFNIIINAKEVDSDKDNSNGIDGLMTYNSIIIQALTKDLDGILTENEINNDLSLKKELLGLIKFNSNNVNTDNTTLTYYTIKVTNVEDEDYCEIEYIYNNMATTYKRTLKMFKFDIGVRTLTGEGYLPYNQDVGDKIEAILAGVPAMIAEPVVVAEPAFTSITDAEVKEYLLSLITFNENEISSTKFADFTISVSNANTHYDIKYSYGSKLNKIFKMKRYSISAQLNGGQKLEYNEQLATDMGTNKAITVTNNELKAELLSLIKINNNEISNIGNFKITVVKNVDSYVLTYEYYDDGNVIEKEFNMSLSCFEDTLYKIQILEEISKEYNATNYQDRAIAYIRSVSYNSMAWNILLGSVDSNFVTYVENYDDTNGTNISSLRDLASLEFVIPATGEKVDFYHMFAVMEGCLTDNPVYADFTGWGGDLLQLAGTDDPTKFNAESGSVFGSADVCADFDAFNIIANLKADNSKSLYEHIVAYYTGLTNESRISQFKQNNFTGTYATQQDLEDAIFTRLQTSSTTSPISYVFSTIFGYNFTARETQIKQCIKVFAEYIY